MERHTAKTTELCQKCFTDIRPGEVYFERWDARRRPAQFVMLCASCADTTSKRRASE